MKKVRNVLLILVLLFTLFLTACEEKGTVADRITEDGRTNFSISLRTHKYKYVENHPNINEDKWVKELGKRTNTKLDIRLIPHQEYVEKMNLMMASGDIPDVVNADGIHDDALAGAVENGVFMPLDDLLEKHGQNLLKTIPKKAWDEMRYTDGKIYGIPEFLSIPSRRGTYIRKDLLDELNLEIPETLDEYVEVMRAFKEHGVKYPFSGREKWKYSELFLGAFNAVPTMWLYDEKDMKLKPAYIMPQMKDALAFHRMLYEEGLLDPEFLTNKYEDWERKIVNGEVGMFIHNYNLFPDWQAKMVNPEHELAIIPSPIGPAEGRGVANYSSVLRTYLINKDAQNPEAIIKFFDWMVTEEAAEFFNFGIEGEAYTKENGKIIYEYPLNDNQKRNEEDFRNYWLWLVKDGAYNKTLAPYIEHADQVVEVFETIAPNEGREWHNPLPLEGEDQHPELRTSEDRQDLWQEYAAKIVLGDLPVDAFDDFVQEYYERGGDEIIEEATEKYENGQTILH